MNRWTYFDKHTDTHAMLAQMDEQPKNIMSLPPMPDGGTKILMMLSFAKPNITSSTLFEHLYAISKNYTISA